MEVRAGRQARFVASYFLLGAIIDVGHGVRFLHPFGFGSKKKSRLPASFSGAEAVSARLLTSREPRSEPRRVPATACSIVTAAEFDLIAGELDADHGAGGNLAAIGCPHLAAPHLHAPEHWPLRAFGGSFHRILRVRAHEGLERLAGFQLVAQFLSFDRIAALFVLFDANRATVEPFFSHGEIRERHAGFALALDLP